MIHRFARRLGRVAYGSFVPATDLVGAETYLEDIWCQGAKVVALTHGLLALTVCLLPLLMGSRKTLFTLDSKRREVFLGRILTHRTYLIRLIGMGVKGHALMAILRFPGSRRELLGAPSS